MTTKTEFYIKSQHSHRQMTLDLAASLYEKLKSFLSVVRPWGYYLPKSAEYEDWPLAYRLPFPNEPTPIRWGRVSEGKPISFIQFLRAYNIEIVEP